MQYLLAHDFGTSGDKATLYSTEGELIKSITRAYPCHYFGVSNAEQNPEDWYAAVKSVTKELVQEVDSKQIIGVSFSGMMMGLVLLDKDGKPLRPAIIWADQRADREAGIIDSAIGSHEYYLKTGSANISNNSLHKLMWIKQNEPEIYRAVDKFVNCKDYIAYRLTGEISTDYSDGSGTGAMDISAFTWASDLIRDCGVDLDKFPEMTSSTDMVGRISSIASEETGLLEGTPVFCGLGDGSAAAVGSGIQKNGDAYCCLGSSAWISIMNDKPFFDKEQRTFNMAGIRKGQVFPLGTMQAAGLSYEWMKDELGEAERLIAEKEGKSIYDLINKEIEKSPAGANEVLFLPYLLGERAPWWDSTVRGSFLGITKTTKRADMFRAVVEGVALNLRQIHEALSEITPITSIRMIGGASKSPTWVQTVSNVLQNEVICSDCVEQSCSLGAAIVAGIGCGVFTDESAIQNFIRVNNTTYPERETKEVYEKKSALLKKAYHGTKDLFK